jgi:hypothetical protein
LEPDPVTKTEATYPVIEVDQIHAWRKNPCPYACPDWLVIFRSPAWNDCVDTASVR